MSTRLFRGYLIIGIMLTVMAAAIPYEASAASFTEKKPNGIMATASGGKIAVSWEKMKSAKCYIVYEAMGSDTMKLNFTKVAKTKKCKIIRRNLQPGMDYNYYVVAKKVSYPDEEKLIEKSLPSETRTTTLPETGKSTIKNFLRVGISPIGSTMYIWGGGWNGWGGNGESANFCTGLSPKWRAFAKKHKKDYSYLGYLFQRENGLDCSGFVGNCVYNIMETSNGKESYVTSASGEGMKYADMGFGKYVSSRQVDDRKAGDVMTCLSHVWICMGECKDGSAVVLHSSPPAVFMAGTPAKDGTSESQAVKLARKYMKKYYPSLYKNYPNQVYRGSSYNTAYGRMRFSGRSCAGASGRGKAWRDPGPGIPG